jgi:hypothetical protein
MIIKNFIKTIFQDLKTNCTKEMEVILFKKNLLMLLLKD